MFDPEMLLRPRLAREFGLKDNTPFASKLPCDEQELKYINLGGQVTARKTVSHIHAQSTRIVDTEQWQRNKYALFTLNYDTPDQLLYRNRFSLRVRFSLNKINGAYAVSQIDMCIKTHLQTGNNVVLFKQTRGEWEIEQNSLKPDLNKMISAHKNSNPPLPKFFTQGGIKDDELFIESIGCSLRSSFPSYEVINRRNKIIVPEFHHTIDQNIFMTPYADVVTGRDDEMEAEFVGFHGLEPGELSENQYEKLMRKSMELLDRTIVTADPAYIRRNLLSKAVRARNALETVYGPDSKTVLSHNFNMQQRIEEASKFSLSQCITSNDVNLDNLWHHVGHLYALNELEVAPKENPFEFVKRLA